MSWQRVLGLNTGPQPPPYHYRCLDRSLLVAPFRDHWVSLFARRLPEWVPANLVTLGASACMWAALCLVAAAPVLPPAALAAAFAVLVQAYLVYDHADGLQAKRTGTSSALGEYLDHYLDAYHGPIVVLAFFTLVGFRTPILVLSTVWCVQAAFLATMVEQKHRGVLRLGRVGSLEGGLFFCLFFLSWLLPPLRSWWTAPLLAGLPPYVGVILAGGLTTLTTAYGCLRRLDRPPLRLALFGIASLTLVVAAALGPWPLWLAIACLLLYTADQIGRVIGSSLLGRREPWPDVVAPLAALLPCAVTGWAAALGGVLLAYLLVRTALGTATVLLPLRAQWRWANPAAAVRSSLT